METKSAEYTNAAVSAYNTRAVSDARDQIGTLSDEVAYYKRRIVLQKHGKPVAALVPIQDLVALHALDHARFEGLSNASELIKGTDEGGLLSLEEAAVKPPVRITSPMTNVKKGGIDFERKGGLTYRVERNRIRDKVELPGGTAEVFLTGDVVIHHIEEQLIDRIAQKVGPRNSREMAAFRRMIVEEVRDVFAGPIVSEVPYTPATKG